MSTSHFKRISFIKDLKSLLILLILGGLFVIYAFSDFTSSINNNGLLNKLGFQANLNSEMIADQNIIGQNEAEKNFFSETIIGETSIEQKPKLKLQFVSNTAKSVYYENVDTAKINQEREALAKIKMPAKVLLIGDSSMIERTGVVFENQLKARGFIIKREGVYSTGLANTGYFDWAKRSKELSMEFKPDIVICFFGSNDGQKILGDNGVYQNLGTSQWEVEYGKNVADFLELSNTTGIKKLYYIGLPISSKAEFTNKYKVINKVAAEQIGNFQNAKFVDIWTRFAPQNQYAPILKDAAGVSGRVKYDDGIHLTDHGSKILFEEVEKMMKVDVEY